MVISADRQELIDTEPLLDLIDDRYDESPEAGLNGLYGFELNDGLTQGEMLLAPRYALLSRGVMIVHGNPGCGKGVFGAFIGWKLRRIFKDRKVLLDYRPRRLFDYGFEKNRYLPFDGEFMMREINRMAHNVGSNTYQDVDAKLDKDGQKNIDLIAKTWIAKNEVLMRKAVWELDELKRSLHNRNPNNPYGKMESNIISVWRHLDLLVLGMCPNIKEIDINGFLQYVTHEVRPEWCVTRKNTTLCRIRRKSHIGADGIIKFETKPFPLFVDGGKPRPEMGVQLMRTDLPLGVPEKRIIDILRSNNGFANLNEISDMSEEEINECAERLVTMHGRYRLGGDITDMENAPILCKTVFDLYNSQDLKNLNPHLRKMEA